MAQNEADAGKMVQPNGGLSAESFEVLSVCGTGAYGRVLMVRAAFDGRIYAMKCVDKTNVVQKGHNSITQAIAENLLLQMMHHPYVVSLHYSFQDAVNLYMLLDYAGGGDLFALIDKKRRLPEEWVRIYGAELVLAIAHCHEKGIVYRDLKPENVMVSLDGHLLLTDFGLSKQLGDPNVTPDEELRTRTVCGTPSYMAPEALSGRPYGRTVDWWTLGCVIYEMAVGAPPFVDDALAMLVRKITSGAFQVPSWLSPDLTSLLKSLLHLDPKNRLGSSAGGVAKLKQHPFFASIDWAKLERKELPAPHAPGATDMLDSDGGSDAQYSQQRKALDSNEGLQQLEKGFRPFERSQGNLEGKDGIGGFNARTALEGNSIELNLGGEIVGISKRFARMMRLRRRKMPVDDPSNPPGAPTQEVDAYVVGTRFVGMAVFDQRDAALASAALLETQQRAKALNAKLLADQTADADATLVPESLDVQVRMWPRGSTRPANTVTLPIPEDKSVRAGAEPRLVNADDPEIAEELLTDGSAMLLVRLKFDIVLVEAANAAALRLKNKFSSSAQEAGDDAPVVQEAVVVVVVTDRTGIELARALVRRRYAWAYTEKRPAEDLARVLDRSLQFEESATKASLAVTATANVVASGTEGAGFAAYVARRDRFITAFPDMTRTIQSIEIADNGAQALVHWTWTGTHLGEYRAIDYDGTLLDLAPTQAEVVCSGVSIDGIRDGRIVRHQTFYDEAALRSQISLERMQALRARDGGGSATAGALEAIRRAPSAPPLPLDVSVKLIAAACGDGLALIDAAEFPERFLYANPSFERTCGYTLDELKESPAGIKLLEGGITSRGSIEQLATALKADGPTRVLIAYRTKSDNTFIALLALAPVKPSAELIAGWRARAVYSAALAAEAVGGDDGDHSTRTAALVAAARRDASLLAKLEGGRLYAMAMLDMSYDTEDAASDAAHQQATRALQQGAQAARANAAAALNGADDTAAFASVPPAAGNRAAAGDLQPTLIGMPRHMGILPDAVCKEIKKARMRTWPSGAPGNGPPDAPPLPRPPAPAAASSPLPRGMSGVYAAVLDKPAPIETDELLLRTCVESDGYCVCISEMCSRDQPLVYINPGFDALTKYNEKDCLGHNCRFLQSNLTDPGSVMLLKWAIAAREPCRVHLLNVTRLGRPFWNLLSLHPCVDKDGRADYYLGVQVEIEANELGALLIEVHRWRRVRSAGSAADAS